MWEITAGLLIVKGCTCDSSFPPEAGEHFLQLSVHRSPVSAADVHLVPGTCVPRLTLLKRSRRQFLFLPARSPVPAAKPLSGLLFVVADRCALHPLY